MRPRANRTHRRFAVPVAAAGLGPASVALTLCLTASWQAAWGQLGPGSLLGRPAASRQPAAVGQPGTAARPGRPLGQPPAGLGQGPAAPPGRPNPRPVPPRPKIEIPKDPAQVVAVVGKSVILVGDLMPRVEARINELVAKAGSEPSSAERQYVQATIFRALLNQTIQLKVLRESFLLAQVGTQAAEKRQEAEQMLQTRARQLFQEQEVPRLMQLYDVKSIGEIDRELRDTGSSFEAARRDFIDQMLAHLYRSEAIPTDPKIAMIDIRNHYADHIDRYRFEAQARWEQLSATFERCGSREATLQAITEMGREAYFGGSMQAVAREKSQEPFARKGGLHDWTTRGALASKQLEEQIFTLPIGQMSEVIEDDAGMHIVRVLQRKPAGTRSIAEVQDEIRQQLKEQKIEQAIKRVTAEMTRRVPVWTIFPDDIDGAMPLSDDQADRSRPDDDK